MNLRCSFYSNISMILILVISASRLTEHIEHLVHTELDDDYENDENFIRKLVQVLGDEGLDLNHRQRRSAKDNDYNDNEDYQMNQNFSPYVDGSGDEIEHENVPPFYSNMSIISFTIGTPSSTTLTKYTPQPPSSSSSCRCEKGQKGDPGICPSDCGYNAHIYQQNCLNSRINLEKLTNSIRQMIIDAKKIALRNARNMGCSCPVVPGQTTIGPKVPSISTPTTYLMVKGDKGDPGSSCAPACLQASQSNVRIVSSVQEARDASLTYPDHTYVHVVDGRGYLQAVFISIAGRLVPIRIESEISPPSLPVTASMSTTLSSPPSKCPLTLPCSKLHLFALGPNARRMCHPKRPGALCSKLSEFDDLCASVAERHQLKGFYRAFMSSSTQWLSNIFTGICVSAQMVNMKEQILFNAADDMFQQKPPLNEIFNVTGNKAQFQYWWHGSFKNGSGSRDTCLDWSRQDSSLSGIASRLPDGKKGLFHYQYVWPCSISDLNMGILCIETNCDKRNFYKH